MVVRHSLAVALSLMTVCANGCLWEPHASLRSAEAEYQECLANNSRTPEQCDGLQAKRDASLDRYERDAKRQWGCRNTPDGCLGDPVAPNS